MFQISPFIAGIPPASVGPAVFQPARVWLVGQRWLVEYHESGNRAGRTVWGDLSTSHGLYTPLLYDPETKTVSGGTELAWWSQPFRDLWQMPHVAGSAVRVERRRSSEKLIFLNTLDFIFGHSLLLLLNSQYYLDRYPDHGLAVVISPELRPFVPEAVAEIWELCVPFSETVRWHQPLSDLFQQCSQEQPTFVAAGLSHPSPARYRLEQFGLKPASQNGANLQSPRILFVYRSSRLWGGSFKSERNRLQRLGHWLRVMWPSVRLEIWGHSPLPASVRGWEDQTRRNRPDYDTDLMEALRDADLVLGAHGSSMLLPTAISRLVLELVPLDKHGSLLQDCVFNIEQRGLREQFWRLRFLYGNGTLNDISPRQVAQLINAMVSMQSHFQLYQGDLWDNPELEPHARAQQFAASIAAEAAAWRRRLETTLRLNWSTRFWQWLRRQSAEND